MALTEWSTICSCCLVHISTTKAPGQTEPISVYFLKCFSCKEEVKGKWSSELRTVTIDRCRIDLISEYACNGVDFRSDTHLRPLKPAWCLGFV